MFIKNIQCSNFRNYHSLNLRLEKEKKINIIAAKNGMGKSNLLEMLYYLSHLRAFRSVQDRDLVRKGEEAFYLRCFYENNEITGNVSVKYNGKKEIVVNDKRILKHSELLGKIQSVLFSTDDIFILNGAPPIRRKFFDTFLSIVDSQYLNALRTYDILLKQKNAALRSRKAEVLYYFDSQIAEVALYLISVREKSIARIDQIFSRIFDEIGFFRQKVSLRYSSSYKKKMNTKEELLDCIKYTNKIDLEKGYCSVGLHKDNYVFYLNNCLFQKYASFGQLRLASLVLKLVQADFYRTIFKNPPILLLDDVILELDKERQRKFINYIGQENQLFITVTDKKYAELFPRKEFINMIEVENGKLLQ